MTIVTSFIGLCSLLFLGHLLQMQEQILAHIVFQTYAQDMPVAVHDILEYDFDHVYTQKSQGVDEEQPEGLLLQQVVQHVTGHVGDGQVDGRDGHRTGHIQDEQSLMFLIVFDESFDQSE